MLVVPVCGFHAADAGTVLQRAHRRSAGGHDAPALESARLTSSAVSCGREYLSAWRRISDTSATRTG